MSLLSEFPVTVYGNVEPYNQVASKARCRIFYKGLNRNGGYIEDSFAEKLVSTLPYTPVKGIYDNGSGDYTDHGASRDLGRIYGVVPENPNGAYEWHLDEDGVNREYYCVDVLLYTAIYQEEASQIVGKAQSMELYPPSINGIWKVIDGHQVYVYTSACFLGLQVLGDNTEPCFEGAAFYTLKDKLEDLLNRFDDYQMNVGGSEMDRKINFKLSDSEKHDAIWSLLNSNYTEEGGWMVDYAICDIYDDYALAFNYNTCEYERIFYAKNEDNVEISSKERTFMMDVSENELNALNAIRALNGGSFDKIDENYSKIETLEADKVNLETENTQFTAKIAEHENTIAALQAENESLVTKAESATADYQLLETEVVSLREYKENHETAQKNEIIAKYSKKISEDVMAKYTENLAQYTMADLEKELAFEMVKNNPSLFSMEPDQPHYVPKDEPIKGIEGILSKYKK